VEEEGVHLLSLVEVVEVEELLFCFIQGKGEVVEVEEPLFKVEGEEEAQKEKLLIFIKELRLNLIHLFELPSLILVFKFQFFLVD
jgi:hypothetical protein